VATNFATFENFVGTNIKSVISNMPNDRRFKSAYKHAMAKSGGKDDKKKMNKTKSAKKKAKKKKASSK